MARIDSLEHFVTDIATAIKNKLNNNSTIYPVNFDTLINSIPTVSAQTKTVTPTTSQQTITPDVGYNALSSVAINAVDNTIDNNIIPGNIKKNVSILRSNWFVRRKWRSEVAQVSIGLRLAI